MNKGLDNGATLSHYRIISKLGKGGMGEVFLAEDTKLNRKVALKILPTEFAEDTDRMNRFVREAKSASALNHPNIITIYEINEFKNTHFIATEFIDGKTLSEYTKSNLLNLKSVLEIAIQVASALDEAHQAGIVHRDIKPDNIMIRSNGLIKILDFGIAKLSESSKIIGEEDATAIQQPSTSPGMIIGTANYMSPEQARGLDVDARSDIFSFGVVLYEMLSGASPFAGGTVSDTLAAVLMKEPKPLENIPPQLAEIVSKTLQKDRNERYKSANELLDDLKEFKQELAIQKHLERTSSPNVEEAGTQILQAPSTAEKSTDSTTGSEEGFRVAVLPFKYRGANAELESLAEGLSEEIITGLSRFSYLRVIGRGSTLGLAADTGDAPAIGKELGARYVLEGSLRQVGTTIRIAAQLVETTTGAHLWAETYDRQFESESIFELQDELVPRIVSTVADWYGVLAQSMSEFVRLKSPEKLNPHEALLRSFGYTSRLTAEDHLETRNSLEQAVSRAPGNADCWAMLSTIYADEYKFGFNLKPDPLDRTLAAALRAVEAAPSNSFANYALAQARFFRKEFDAFRSAAERAIQLNPMNGSVAAYMGQLIYHSGDLERGCELSEKARAMNPQHPGWYWIVPFHQAYDTQNYRLALSYVLKVNMPGLFIYHMHLTATYGQLSERERAAQAARDLLAIAPDFELFVRDFCEKFEDPETVERMIEGLRKAGMKIAAAANQEEPKTQILKASTTAENESLEAKTVMLQPDIAEENAEDGQVFKSTTNRKSKIQNPKSKLWLFGLLGLIVLVGGFFGYKYFAPTNKQIESIAVMPFINESGDADAEYLSDGMTETLIGSLSQLPNLAVKARSTVFYYKGKEISPKKIGEELKVQAVLLGRIVQRGQDLRLNLELVNTNTQDVIWSGQYNRKQADLVSLQSEIARDVSDKLRLKLSGADEQKLNKVYTTDPEAYQLYLKGRFYWLKLMPEDMNRSLEFYQQAIDKDPAFALAYAGISDVYMVLGIPDVMMGTIPPQESVRKARNAADKALELDPTLAEAYASRAHVKWKERDWAGAEDDFKRSIELNENYPNAHRFYSIYLASAGRSDEAIREVKRAEELEPLSASVKAHVAFIYYFARRYDEAVEAGKKALELEASSPVAHQRLGSAYEQKGMFPEAIAEFQKAVDGSNRVQLAITSLAHAFALAGKRAEAEKLLAELRQRSDGGEYVSSYLIAEVYAALGEKETAFKLLDKAYDERSIDLVLVKVDPRLDPLRDDSRFKDLLKRMNFSE